MRQIAVHNVLSMSEVDEIERICMSQGTPYKMIILGTIPHPGREEGVILRQFEYEGIVIKEQLMRGRGQFTDDYIKSKRFKKGQEPGLWPLESPLM